MKISVAAQHKWLTTEYQENAFSQSQPYPTIKSRVCTFCKRPERAHARSRRALLVSHDDMHPVSSSYPVLYCSLPFPAYDAPDSSAYFICQNEVCMQFHRVPKSERERERERGRKKGPRKWVYDIRQGRPGIFLHTLFCKRQDTGGKLQNWDLKRRIGFVNSPSSTATLSLKSHLCIQGCTIRLVRELLMWIAVPCKANTKCSGTFQLAILATWDKTFYSSLYRVHGGGDRAHTLHRLSNCRLHSFIHGWCWTPKLYLKPGRCNRQSRLFHYTRNRL